MFYEVKNKGNMIAAPINVYSTNRIDVTSLKRACFAHYVGC